MNISVVIPTYNRADLLGETLDAVLAQTLKPAEIIVVDDGSTDSTEAVLARFAPQVQHVRIKNSGELVARNIGLRAATGDLVAFCDSDDVWRPEFLATMAALFEAEPDLHAAYSDFVIIRDGVWQNTRKFTAAPAGFWDFLRPAGPEYAVFDQPIIERLLRFQPFFPSAMVVHRGRFIEIGGWDEGVSRIVGCDLATALRVVNAPPIGIAQKALVGIRKHTSNFSGDVQAMNLGDARVLEHVLAKHPGMSAYETPITASIIERRIMALDTAFARGDLAGVLEIYALLPDSARSRSVRLKRRIAGLPTPVAPIAAIVILSLGTIRSRLRR
jgi:hypothetical protein